MLRHGRVTDPSAESEPVVATQRSGDGGGTFVRGGVSVAAVAFVGLGRAVDGSATCGTTPEDPGEAPSPATDGDPSPGPPLSGASLPAFASAPGSSAGRGLSSAGNPAANSRLPGASGVADESAASGRGAGETVPCGARKMAATSTTTLVGLL